MLNQSNIKYVLVQDEVGLEDILRAAAAKGILAVDTETTGLHHIRDKVVGFSCSDGVHAWYVPVAHAVGVNIPGGVDTATQFFKKLEALSIKLVFHNALFDLSFVYRSFGVLLTVAHDTMAMAYVLGEVRKGLKPLVYRYFFYIMTPLKELLEKEFGKKWKKEKKTFADLLPAKALEYAAEDAYYTFYLAEMLLPKVKEEGADGVYRLEMEMIAPTLCLNFAGIRIDVPLLQAIAAQLNTINAARLKTIHQLASHEFSPASSKQLSSVLFSQLGLPVQKRSKKTGAPSTDAETLEALSSLHPIVSLVAQWRSETKLVTSYAEKIPNSVEDNGKIYASFRSLGSVSGRLTSSSLEAHDRVKYGLNFQNIANKVVEIQYNGALKSVDVRRAFIPVDESMLWLKVDFSQVEYRIMASLAGEAVLIDGFKRGVDYHTQTASVFLGKPLEEITKEERDKGKTFNFALSYGMAVYTMAKRLGVPEAEAQLKYNQFFERTPKLLAFIEGCKEYVREHHLIRTFFGRIRYLDLDMIPPQKKEAFLRKAFNTMIQGTAADVLKIATVRVHKAIKKFGLECQLLLTEHDELDFQIKKAIFDEAAATIKQAMEIPVPKEWAPITVDIEAGPSWSSLQLGKYEVKNPLPQEEFSGWGKLF